MNILLTGLVHILILGKKMMQHMNRLCLHNHETFGSRTGEIAPLEVLVNLQLFFDHNRIWRLPIAT